MEYNNFIFFFHYTSHLHALWIVPSAQCQFACKQLPNKQTNKSLQQMSDTDSELYGVTNAMEAAEIAGEFKLRALNNNKLFYFSKIIIQKTQLCAARRFRQCAIIDNTNFMTCTRLHPNYNTNLPLDGVKEENERAATPTQRNPMSRAPTRNPLPLPTLHPPEIPTPQLTKTTHIHLDLSPCLFQPTLPPVYVWTPPAAGFLSPPDKVLRTKETGPRCRSRPGLHVGTRIGKRGK